MKRTDERMQERHSRAWAAYLAGKLDEASRQYATLCRKHQRDDQAWMMQGVIAGQRGDYVRAEQCLRRAVALRPENLNACLNHGLALFNLGEHEPAIGVYRKLLERVPGHAQALFMLGNAYAQNDRLIDAEAAYRAALQSQPENAATCGNLANVLAYQGYPAAALEYYQRALQIDPAQPGVHSNMLLCLHYEQLLNATEMFDRHRTWAKVHAAGVPRFNDFQDSAGPAGCLHVGLVTSDLRNHSVAYFLEPLLTHHDRERVRLFCYSDARFHDGTTARLGVHLEALRNSAVLTDEALAEVIRQDRIDILIDLAGHTENNRLPVFARRPAPMQITWLGYPDTTGLDEIDYRITDAIADPPGQEDFYSEELLRLDGGFLCFSPPSEAPEVVPLPALANGYVTFGSFNALTKITPGVLDAWAAILGRLPRSRLLIKNRQLTDSGLRERATKEFECRGVDSSRLMLLGKSSKQEHMSAYNSVDIALDSYPYNGTTTTCDSMWMGIPVITRAGDTHVSRVGSSLLSRVGLDALVSADWDGYVECAVTLASDIGRLAGLRGELRETMRNSRLCDAISFTAAFQDLLEDVWRRRAESRKE